MCLGLSKNRSNINVSLPKELRASLLADSIAPDKSSGSYTARMPFPPPPAAALTISGKPISFAIESILPLNSPSCPGIVGTPASSIIFLDSALSPMTLIVSGLGPMKIKPESITCCAKSPFSDKKPYPGCIASDDVAFAASIILSKLR